MTSTRFSALVLMLSVASTTWAADPQVKAAENQVKPAEPQLDRAQQEARTAATTGAAAHSPAKARGTASAEYAPGHVLGPDDEILVWAANAPEVSAQPLTVDGTGHVNVPLAGRVKAAGLTTRQLEAEILTKMRQYIREPQVSVNVTQIRSQPVSVIGAVNTPGVHQLRGKKTLVEILSMAGGLRNDSGPTATITRDKENGQLPLPNAQLNPTGKFFVAEINIEAMMKGDNPEYNVAILPHDVISVRRAQMVYVVGEVTRAGGFVLTEKKNISVLQALSLAGGLNRFAAPANAKIIRGDEGEKERTEIAVNVKQILRGKADDVVLRPDDILFIPDSSTKRAGFRTAEAVLQGLTGIMIWRGGAVQ